MELEPLRKCGKCGLEALITDDLVKFKKRLSSKYNRENQCRKCATIENNRRRPRASMRQITCANCGSVFESKWNNAKFCSPECRRKYLNAKQVDSELERRAQEKLKLRLAELDAPECEHICIEDKHRCSLKKGHTDRHTHKMMASLLSHKWMSNDRCDLVLPPPDKTACSIHNDLTLDDLDAIQIRIAVENIKPIALKPTPKLTHRSRNFRYRTQKIIVEALAGADRSLVVIRQGYPTCNIHGAMNMVSSDGLWRCISTQSLKRSEDVCRAGCIIKKELTS